ncbi:MAG: hypothetical protein R6X13_10260, partial [bacterium]
TTQGAVIEANGIPIAPTGVHQRLPALGFDGTDYLAAWTDNRSGRADIFGARVRPDGSVYGGGAVVVQEGEQLWSVLARGPGNQMLLAFQGWAGAFGGDTCGDYRIWGRMNPGPAVAEPAIPGVRMTSSVPTIVRGVLSLPASSVQRGASCVLLDACGRHVMALRAGDNDVSGLAPGVYFVSGVARGARGEGSRVRQVVVAK